VYALSRKTPNYFSHYFSLFLVSTAPEKAPGLEGPLNMIAKHRNRPTKKDFYESELHRESGTPG